MDIGERLKKHEVAEKQRQQASSHMRVRASVEGSDMFSKTGQPKDVKSLLPAKHAEALKVIGSLGKDQVRNKIRLPRDKMQRSLDMIKDIWRCNKRLPKRKEATEDAMVRHEVTWV